MAKITQYFVFSAKTNTEKLYFTYLPAFVKDLLESDCFIIYFIYCLFLETYYIHWLCYKFFFLFYSISLDMFRSFLFL